MNNLTTTKWIPLTQGQSAQVDAGDFDLLMLGRWYARRDKKRGFYAERDSAGHSVLMHRVIMGSPEGFQVDHINGDGLDNRRENLRLVSNAQNQQNRIKRKAGSSKFKGVHLEYRSRRWYAKIKLNGKSIHLGSFLNEIEAAKAYNSAALVHFGEYAKINEFEPSEAEGSKSPVAPETPSPGGEVAPILQTWLDRGSITHREVEEFLLRLVTPTQHKEPEA